MDLRLRQVEPEDVGTLFSLIQALAEYEKLSTSVTGNVAALQEHLFGSHPYVEAIIAEYAGETAGFALFFPNYSNIKSLSILFDTMVCLRFLRYRKSHKFSIGLWSRYNGVVGN